jgi:diguanylate cyclase (GGDEF)-like protein
MNRPNRDSLTGAFDRDRYFQDLDSALHRSSSVAMLLADVDEFRNVNDLGGNQFGDSVLQEITKVLAKQCKDSGTQGPSRFAGATICFILENEDKIENARLIAEALRQDVERLRFEPYPKLLVTIRLGVSLSPMDGTTSNELLAKADSLVYRQPRRRNQVRMTTEH